MNFGIRNAVRGDCQAMLELIRGLAKFERAPDEVSVSLEEFEDSGFGENPVWWAFVAEVSNEVASKKAEVVSQNTQDPLLVRLMDEQQESLTVQPEEEQQVQSAATRSSVEENIQLPEAMLPVLPESLGDLQTGPVIASGRIVAFALYYIRYSTWKGRRMYLEDLYVDEDFRSKGIGTALMDALIGRSITERLHGISWQVLEWNEPAITFYKRYQARFDSEWVNVAIDV